MRRVIVAAAFVLLGVGGCTEPTATAQSPVVPATHGPHPAYSNEPPQPLRDGERFVQLTMPRPYTPTPPNGGTDEYRCFLVDPKFTERTFVVGSQFLPQNADVVHHAIFFRVQPADVPQARQLDEASPGDGWTCFGGTGLGTGAFRQLNAGAAWIAAWAPGGRETLLKNRTGYEMAPGSQIVMQVHYNLLATNGKPAGTDRSGIRLRVMSGKANLDPLQTTLIPAPVELPCAAGEQGQLCDREQAILDVWRRFGHQAGSAVAGLNLLCNHGKDPVAGSTQHCDLQVRQTGTVYAVAGHMHLLGRSIKVELNPDTPKARTLLDVPVYNFDDQGSRPLTAPVRVQKGDVYRVTCTHDATLRRQLPELRKLPPRYVVWGEGTSDEMCLGIVIWSPA
ncbi:MAG TPA: monooxygenase [Micromonosporaceae bacterium]|nr:monooxygenase [Micromonosporaceae bacterium]